MRTPGHLSFCHSGLSQFFWPLESLTEGAEAPTFYFSVGQPQSPQGPPWVRWEPMVSASPEPPEGLPPRVAAAGASLHSARQSPEKTRAGDRCLRAHSARGHRLSLQGNWDRP